MEVVKDKGMSFSHGSYVKNKWISFLFHYFVE